MIVSAGGVGGADGIAACQRHCEQRQRQKKLAGQRE
jgi:hypothetical protein